MSKRLYRSRDGMVAGVASGIADYFGFDVSLVRLVWVLFVLAGGSGFLAYFICWIVMPRAPHGQVR